MKRNILLLLLTICVVACDDKLEQVNPNSVTQVNFWKNETDVLSGLAATYKVFRNRHLGYFEYEMIMLANGRGDDFYIRNDINGQYEASTFTNSTTNNTGTGLYSGCYIGIFRANQVIENAPKAAMSDQLKSTYIAEAKFLRALNYYHLVINFGGVPIITTVPKNQEEYFSKQSSMEAVWAQIEEDLKESKSLLPVSYPAQWVGRATKGAAIGYLAKAYVYQNKWAQAESEFKLLVTANGTAQAPFTYDLLANYEDNFLKSKDNNAESLFEIQNQNIGGTSSAEGSSEAQGTTTAQAFAPTEVAGWFEAYPTNKIFDEFQKEKTAAGELDPRMYASLIWDYPGAVFYNKPYKNFATVFNKKSRIKKYQNWQDNDEGVKVSEINEKTLRFDDIILLYAETLTMQGRVSEAYPMVDRIRTRAKLTTLKTGLNQNDMMAEIRHQRMIEFFREGQRFYDLRRWNLLAQELAIGDKEGKQFLNVTKHAYLPIPQNEMNTNPNIEQAAAWK